VRMMRWIRQELAGAWRSVRYDVARRDSPSRQRTEVLYPEYDAYQRPPRRGYAAVGLGAVVAAGVAAVYVAVAGGLGALLSPIASAVPGLGGGAPAVRSTGTGAPVAQQPAGGPHAVSRPSRVPVRQVPSATRPAEVPAVAPAVVSTCPCPVPVPTPESPSPTTGHSPSPSPSPSVTPSPSASPDGGAVEQP
jgi:hypothetical protein